MVGIVGVVVTSGRSVKTVALAGNSPDMKFDVVTKIHSANHHLQATEEATSLAGHHTPITLLREVHINHIKLGKMRVS